MESEFDKDLFRQALRECLTLSGLGNYLLPETEEKMTFLCERLFHENTRYNLTAIKTPAEAALLHFADSLTAAALLPPNARVIDVGCGGGFPSLPVAICRPDLSILSLDATEKKVRYVEESCRLLGLSNLHTLCGRAEEVAADSRYRETFDVAMARAVAALPVLSEICLPFCRIGGLFLALKGEKAKEEMAAAQCAPQALGASPFSLLPLNLKNSEKICVRFAVMAKKERATPAKYPRPYPKILKSPL